MEKPKIKLLIPIEIKDGCELPEKDNDVEGLSINVPVIENGIYYHNVWYNFKKNKWSDINFRFKPSHWIKEVETDLTIDELKKLGVIK